MRRLLAAIGLVIGIAALALQFALSLQGSFAAGRSLAGAAEFFFSFFTVLTNTAVVLAYVAALTGRPAFFAGPRVRAGLAVAIGVVSIVYAAILSSLWQPEGLLFLADTALHYVAPALYIIWWLGFAREGASRLRDIPAWLVYPLAYLAYALARGAVLGQYPYPFLDLTVKSPGQVAQACALMVALFAVVSLAVVAADRWLPPRPVKNRAGTYT